MEKSLAKTRLIYVVPGFPPKVLDLFWEKERPPLSAVCGVCVWRREGMFLRGKKP